MIVCRSPTAVFPSSAMRLRLAVAVASLAAFAATRGAGASMAPYRLVDVALLPSSIRGAERSFEASAAALNAEYMKSIDTERLLIGFRRNAGLDWHGRNGSAQPYHGWCGWHCMWLGHLLSGLAHGAATTRDNWLRAKAIYLVRALREAQVAYAALDPEHAGWLGTKPAAETLGLLQYANFSSAFVYGAHKLLQGLLDVADELPTEAELGASGARPRGSRSAPPPAAAAASAAPAGDGEDVRALALRMASEWCDAAHRALAPLIASRGWGWWSAVFTNPGNAGSGYDFGGIYDALVRVHAHTRQPRHLELALYFCNWPFFDALLGARGAHAAAEVLHHRHANAHVPVAVGYARAWHAARNGTQLRAALAFWRALAPVTFATGSSSVDEHWAFPGQMGHSVQTLYNATSGGAINSRGFHTQETCVSVNTLKLAWLLLGAEPDELALADAAERLVQNGVLGTQHPGTPGVYAYLTPLGAGVTRAKWDWWGWGKPFGSFWCCYGTAVEAFARLADGIFWHTDADAARGAGDSAAERRGGARAQLHRVSLARYTPALLTLRGRGAHGAREATLRLDAWLAPDARALEVELSASSDSTSDVELRLRLRVPGWSESAEVRPSAASAPHASSGACSLKRASWCELAPVRIAPGARDAVVARARFGMGAHVEHIADTRAEFASVFWLLWGPWVLVGLTAGDNRIEAEPAEVQRWLRLLGPGDDAGAQQAGLVPVAVGRALRFVAPGADGRQLAIVPLNRVVNETYAATFNITLAPVSAAWPVAGSSTSQPSDSPLPHSSPQPDAVTQ